MKRQTDKQVEVRRIEFIANSRKGSLKHLGEELSRFSSLEFAFRLILPKGCFEKDVPVICGDVVIEVTPQEGGATKQFKVPLACPDSTHRAILQAIYNKAKSGLITN